LGLQSYMCRGRPIDSRTIGGRMKKLLVRWTSLNSNNNQPVNIFFERGLRCRRSRRQLTRNNANTRTVGLRSFTCPGRPIDLEVIGEQMKKLLVRWTSLNSNNNQPVNIFFERGLRCRRSRRQLTRNNAKTSCRRREDSMNCSQGFGRPGLNTCFSLLCCLLIMLEVRLFERSSHWICLLLLPPPFEGSWNISRLW
jgi:hypothetical protein